MKRGITEMTADGWKIKTTNHTKQYDSSSCGVYVVKVTLDLNPFSNHIDKRSSITIMQSINQSAFNVSS
jgi:hypothetical protein